jgi:uncharacterized protein YuzE
MQIPISLKIDYAADAGYIRYRSLPPGQHVARTQRLTDDVNVDFDANAEILGIELLAFGEEALEATRRFAQAHDLALPAQLTSASVPA